MSHHLFQRRSHGGGLGLSLIAAAAGAAATYYLYATKDGARKRSKILRFARANVM